MSVFIALPDESKMFLQAVKECLKARKSEETGKQDVTLIQDIITRFIGESFVKDNIIRFKEPVGFDSKENAEQALNLLLDGLERGRSSENHAAILIAEAAGTTISRHGRYSGPAGVQHSAPLDDLGKTLAGSYSPLINHSLPPEWAGWTLDRNAKENCIKDMRKAASHAVIELDIVPERKRETRTITR